MSTIFACRQSVQPHKGAACAMRTITHGASQVHAVCAGLSWKSAHLRIDRSVQQVAGGGPRGALQQMFPEASSSEVCKGGCDAHAWRDRRAALHDGMNHYQLQPPPDISRWTCNAMLGVLQIARTEARRRTGAIVCTEGVPRFSKCIHKDTNSHKLSGSCRQSAV